MDMGVSSPHSRHRTYLTLMVTCLDGLLIAALRSSMAELPQSSPLAFSSHFKKPTRRSSGLTPMIRCIPRGTHGTVAHRASSRPSEVSSIRLVRHAPMTTMVSSWKFARPQMVRRRKAQASPRHLRLRPRRPRPLDLFSAELDLVGTRRRVLVSCGTGQPPCTRFCMSLFRCSQYVHLSWACIPKLCTSSVNSS